MFTLPHAPDGNLASGAATMEYPYDLHSMTRGIQFEGRPVWAEVSISAILHNLEVIRRQTGVDRKIMAVVKANAYGLGAIYISKALVRAGVDAFAVTSSAEGIELREAGVRAPILLLTGFWPGEEKRLLDFHLMPAVNRLEQLPLLERAAARWRGKNSRKKFPFHLKIDTGMNRLGISPDDIPVFARALAECPHLELAGTFTHFASSDNFRSHQNIDQEQRFSCAVKTLNQVGVSPGMVHMANSGAICARPETWADMVRPGAILYGYHQSFEPPERRVEVEKSMDLKPCLSLRARIISLRDIPAGQAVGYSATFVTERPSRIAVIAAGYADGLLRGRSNRGCVLLHGQAAPLVGVISMDLSMIEVTDIPEVKLGDVVTIYGQDGEKSIHVDQVARQLGTVTSDLLCSLGRRVPRFYSS